MKAVIRSYCVFVLLGRPPKRPFRTLARFCFGARAIWLTPHAPFWTRFLGIFPRPMPQDEGVLLWELEHIASEYEGKMLSLIPLSPDTKHFVENNKESLAPSYRTERKST